MIERTILYTMCLGLAGVLACDVEGEPYEDERIVEFEDEDFDEDSQLTNYETTEPSELGDEIWVEEWEQEPLELEDIAAVADTSQGPRFCFDGVRYATVTYGLFNCPSNNTMRNRASDICFNKGAGRTHIHWISKCYGVSGAPSFRRRKVKFPGFRNLCGST